MAQESTATDCSDRSGSLRPLWTQLTAYGFASALFSSIAIAGEPETAALIEHNARKDIIKHDAESFPLKAGGVQLITFIKTRVRLSPASTRRTNSATT